jgi:hypothetical protein
MLILPGCHLLVNHPLKLEKLTYFSQLSNAHGVGSNVKELQSKKNIVTNIIKESTDSTQLFMQQFFALKQALAHKFFRI